MAARPGKHRPWTCRREYQDSASKSKQRHSLQSQSTPNRAYLVLLWHLVRILLHILRGTLGDDLWGPSFPFLINDSSQEHQSHESPQYPARGHSCTIRICPCLRKRVHPPVRSRMGWKFIHASKRSFGKVLGTGFLLRFNLHLAGEWGQWCWVHSRKCYSWSVVILVY